VAGTDELQAEGGAGRSLTADEPARGSLPRSWFTEEMVEEFCRTFYGPPWESQPLVHEVGRRRVAESFRAIAPMVTEWVGDLQASEGELMREAGYRAGYNQAVKDLD
jgi:hypothetical protein